MCNLYRGPSIDASCQVSGNSIDASYINLTKRFQRRTFVLTDWNEMGNIYREQSIDAPYQVLVHLAKRFQRRIFLKTLTNQKQELPVVAMFVNGLGRNVQSS
jgi:hypothetical protein